MSKHKIFDTIIEQLTDSVQNTAVILDRFIKFAVNLVNTTEDLQEELTDKDLIIQMNIVDIDFNFWLKVYNGKVIYEKGVNEGATLIADMTKDQVIKMIQGELLAIDDFMKGKIKASRRLGHGLLFIKIFRLIVKYLTQAAKKKM